MSRTTVVVVCAHTVDRLPWTTKCLRSVLAGHRLPDELIVVVDGSDALQETLRESLGREGAQVLPNQGTGAAAARTTAVMHTKADICLFIDDDAWAEPTWLADLASVFDADQVAGAGGRVVPDWEVGAEPLPVELLWVVGSTYRGHPEDPVPISRPIGANMAARTEVIREVGGFPASFGPRGGRKSSSNEELALFTAIRRRYGQDSVLYVPSAVVHHFVSRQRTTWRYLFERSWVEGTSKADVSRVFGRPVMVHDHTYARSTLVPAIARYAGRGLLDRDRRSARAAAQCGVTLAVTAGGYLLRLAGAA